MGKLLILSLCICVFLLLGCTSDADEPVAAVTEIPPTNTPVPPTEVTPSETPDPTDTPLPTNTPSPTPTNTATPPPIVVHDYFPSPNTPLEELVLLRGEDHQLDLFADVSGGVGKLAFEWRLEENGLVVTTAMDPDPLAVEPGAYDTINLTISDRVGQIEVVTLPRVVKVSDPAEPDWWLGVHAHLDYIHGYYHNEEEISKALELLVDVGAEGLRVDFPWTAIHGGGKDAPYTWVDMDRMVQLIEEAGLEIHGDLSASPHWASSNPNAEDYWMYPPVDPKEFGEYAYQVALRYPEVTEWSIWNEPNLTYYFRGYDPDVYSEIMKEAFINIKYANPDAAVVIGNLANGPAESQQEGMNPDVFLQRVFVNGGANYSDGVGIHPFVYPGNGTWLLRQKIVAIRKIMDDSGAEKHFLTINEFGWGLHSGISNHTIARWLTDSYRMMSDMEEVDQTVWTNLRDRNGVDWGGTMGLVTIDWEPKPQYWAFKEFAAGYNTP